MPLLDDRKRIVLLSVLLAAVITAAAPPAFPESPKSRGEALAALASPDAAARGEAVVWIANRGSMKDALLLHERLRDESLFVRGYAEQGLWMLWARSGDRGIDALMARGGKATQAGRHAEAIELFTSVVRAKPDFAEGWNRRATVYYLAGEYDKSLADCDQVLKRNPLHFGALSGMGQIYTELGQYDKALEWFGRALEVNPNMVGVQTNIESVKQLLRERRKNST
jgi:tetratricopeptide (TPR) repeat protein